MLKLVDHPRHVLRSAVFPGISNFCILDFTNELRQVLKIRSYSEKVYFWTSVQGRKDKSDPPITRLEIGGSRCCRCPLPTIEGHSLESRFITLSIYPSHSVSFPLFITMICWKGTSSRNPCSVDQFRESDHLMIGGDGLGFHTKWRWVDLKCLTQWIHSRREPGRWRLREVMVRCPFNYSIRSGRESERWILRELMVWLSIRFGMNLQSRCSVFSSRSAPCSEWDVLPLSVG